MWMYLIVIAGLGLVYWWRKFASIPGPRYPPGPTPLPLLGHLPVLTAKSLLVGLDKVHDEYGNVASVNLGPTPKIVVIGDYDVLKEAFKDDKAAARPPEAMWFNVYFRFGNGHDARGLLFSAGKEWNEQRRFTLRRLRDFGLGKSSMEDLILEEVQQFCGLLDQRLDEPISVRNIFNISVVNALWTLIAGKRFELNDPDLIEIVHKTDRLVAESSNVTLVNLFPSVRHIAPQLSGWTQTSSIMFDVIDFVAKIIDKHLVHFEKDKEILKDTPNDFIDAFLAQNVNSEAGSSFHGQLGLQNLRSTILDLLFAGTETTSTALTWATLFMIRHPEHQTKVQEEILRVVGTSRPVRLEDKPDLPYTEAVCNEVLRMSCIAPLGLPHYAQEDIHAGGFMIPKGTTIFPNLHRITRNPKVFSDPNTFNPNRFIDDNGNYKKNDHNVAFSIGKRDCLGKTLAITELFLFFASLMQRYTFKSTESDLTKLDMDPVVTFTQSPKPFKVVISKGVLQHK